VRTTPNPRARAAVATALVPWLGLAACGGGAATGGWVEHEAARGQTHVTAPARGGSAAAAIDPTTIDSLAEADVLAALDRVGDAAPAAQLALRAARLAHHRGDDAAARALIGRAASAADAPALHAALAALADQLAEPPVDAAAICVLLPLSGRYAAVGAELRPAIELAPADGTSWKFLDTRGEPDGAVAAVDDAIARGCAGILGPVGTREAIAAAREAALRAIPIALLAPEDGADVASGVFRLVGSPADEGRAVARMAAADGFPTVAVLAPRDDVGGEAADAFVAAAAQAGLAVTARGSYDPTGGDVQADVKQFLGLVPAQNPRLAEHLARHGAKGWATFSPDVPYSLLYIPDRFDRAAIVAAYLPYFNVELRTTDFPDQAMLARKHGGRVPQVVQLVGGGGWHHPSLPIRGGTAVQGALIVDVWAAELGGDVAAQFAAEYLRVSGHAASGEAAEAYDAATLIAAARLAASHDGDVRRALLTAIAHARLDDGACGAAAIGADGEIERDAAVMQVEGDDLINAP
jgi:ABC-type branched-subunit amino acid transport system substrate-binding protein